jgi:hypothetical protein
MTEKYFGSRKRFLDFVKDYKWARKCLIDEVFKSNDKWLKIYYNTHMLNNMLNIREHLRRNRRFKFYEMMNQYSVKHHGTRIRAKTRRKI